MLARMISGARRSSSHAATPLTVPAVPTGMKAGVRTTPCGVVSSPARAADSGSRFVIANGSMSQPGRPAGPPQPRPDEASTVSTAMLSPNSSRKRETSSSGSIRMS